MKIKMMVGGALCVASLGLGGTVFAGEITGNGKETPIKSRQDCNFQTGECPAPAGPANSFCAFSGLNDDPDEPGTYRTQSWGTDGPSKIGGQGVSGFAKDRGLMLYGPGTECRGGFPSLGGH